MAYRRDFVSHQSGNNKTTVHLSLFIAPSPSAQHPAKWNFPWKKKKLRDLRRFEIETRASTPNDNTKFSSTRGERRHPGAPFISHNFPINAIKPSLDTGLNLSFQPGGGQNSGISPRSSINPARHDSSTLKGRFYQSTLFVSSLLRGPMYFYDFQILSKRVGKYVEVDGVDTWASNVYADFKIFWKTREKIGR